MGNSIKQDIVDMISEINIKHRINIKHIDIESPSIVANSILEINQASHIKTIMYESFDKSGHLDTSSFYINMPLNLDYKE